MAKKKHPPLDTSILQDLPPLSLPPKAFTQAFPGIVRKTAVKRLDLFLRLAESVLADIRERDLFGVHRDPTPGTLRGYDYYANDPARIFAMATSLNRYSINHGVIPDFTDPRTATQKLLVMKMFGEIPNGPPADKLKAESFVPDDVRPLLTPFRRVWKSQNPELPSNDEIAPGRYFIKTNFGAGNNIAVTYPLRERMRLRLQNKIQYWFERRHMHGFWAGEWWYHTIEPQIYLEESLAAKGEDIDDWKLWVAGKKLQIVQVDQDRSSDHVQRIYDRDFNLLPHELYYPSDSNAAPAPKRFGDMVRIAEAIAQNLEFARVDLYIKDEQLYLGEITLCPFGAKKKMRAPELEKIIGDGWVDTSLFP